MTSRLAWLAAAFAWAQAVWGSGGLVDDPIHGDNNAVQYLDGGSSWTVSAPGGDPYPANVPGDLLTDLEAAEVIGDPLFELNFQAQIWDDRNWTYTTTFDLAVAAGAATEVYLVLDSVKMAGDVALNGKAVGGFFDQHLRYKYPVKKLLLAAGNTLTITFTTSSDPRNDQGRYMSCSGAWDWAPYGTTFNNGRSHTFSKGIIKSVYLVPVSTAAIAHVVPHISLAEAYPTSPLNTADFDVSLDAVLWAPTAEGEGTLLVAVDWAPSAPPVTVLVGPLVQGENTVHVTLPKASQVALWWPLGMGKQAMYQVNVSFTSQAGVRSWATRQVGFRHAVLVTADDTDPAALEGVDGTGELTMRWKVNGADMMSFGANMIPMEEMEGRQTTMAYEQLLANAAAANENTLRVWGGGLFLPEVFYDTADRLGILLLHDLMYGTPWFGGNSSVPQNTPTQAAEIAHQVRRLSHHPSIVLWNGGNEDLGRWDALITDFLMPAVARVDSTRVLWPASPSRGFLSGVDRLTGFPNGKPFSLPSSSSSWQQTHKAQQWPPVSAAAAAVVESWTGKCHSASGNCTFVSNVDYDKGYFGKRPSASSAQDCCELCTADPTCWAGSLYEGLCYFKPRGAGYVSASGVIVCIPPDHPMPPLPPNPHHGIESHGPYQHGAGFQTVNGHASLDLFHPNLPPVLADPTTAYGPHQYGVYASEFGVSSFSSFESMSATLSPGNWSAHAAPMVQRNYPTDNIVAVYFSNATAAKLNETGAFALQRATYLGSLGSALQQKSDIEARRSRNQLGILIWQLGEIWPTGGWGTLEYGSVTHTKGQVLGGRWKLAHHNLKQHLFRNTVLLCGTTGRCVAKHDDAVQGFKGTWITQLWRVTDSAIIPLGQGSLAFTSGAAQGQWICVDGSSLAGGGGDCPPFAQLLKAKGCEADGSDCVLETIVAEDGTGRQADHHVTQLTTPGQMQLAMDIEVTASCSNASNADMSVNVTVSNDGGGSGKGTALYVSLTTLEGGIFETNGFLLAGGHSQIVRFLPLVVGPPPKPSALAASLRVDHVEMYMA